MATKTLSGEVRDKLFKLIPRLASDQSGEVVATVAAMRRVLAASTLDLHDLAAAIKSPPISPASSPQPEPRPEPPRPPDPPTRRPEPPPQRDPPREAGAGRRGRRGRSRPHTKFDSLEEKLDFIERGRAFRSDLVRDNENGFLAGLRLRARQERAVSAKQEAWVNNIVDRIWSARYHGKQ
jgi:hypothetical protein